MLQREHIFSQADKVRRKYYGTDVYIRGLIELTNHCKNNCYYCGIRSGNKNISRYRLSKQEILQCCKTGYQLGFRTFVLQGGEDNYYTDHIMCGIVHDIKNAYPHCAVTLSLGEKSQDSYKAYHSAGADRYLLRHETANPEHYSKLHPDSMSLQNRKKCLWALKDIGYQVGTGFMIGSPYQERRHLLEDLQFMEQLEPDMIGIGPYISHKDTPFKHFESGNLDMCLKMISIVRLMFQYALIPATTALATIHPKGRELGLQAGANVVMPNLSPVQTRALYALYKDKAHTGQEAAEYLENLKQTVQRIGYRIVTDIGNVKKEVK